MNELRRLIESGQIDPSMLSPNALAQMQQPMQTFDEFAAGPIGDGEGYISGDNGTRITFGRKVSDAPMYPTSSGNRNNRVMQVFGDDGTPLGQQASPEGDIDYTRGMIEIPGQGKGYYSKDGGSAYINGKKVVLGYDREASDRRNDRELKRRQAETSIAATEEQIAASRDSRTRREMPKPIYDAERGAFIFPPSGQGGPSMVPVEGLGPSAMAQKREAEQKEKALANQALLDAGKATLDNIDALIGKRDPATGKLVEGAKPHGGFQSAVGTALPFVDGASIPGLRFVPGTDTADFSARLDQLKGGAFLEAFKSLRGGGQITEVEGKKATDAITRMSLAQSEVEFVKAAQEFRNVVQNAMQRAQGMGMAPPAGAVAKLRANPALRDQFDQKYGAGASAQVLGQ